MKYSATEKKSTRRNDERHTTRNILNRYWHDWRLFWAWMIKKIQYFEINIKFITNFECYKYLAYVEVKVSDAAIVLPFLRRC